MPPTKEEWLALGWDERFLVDRMTHPSYHMSSWPVTGSGTQLLGSKAEYRLPHINHQSVLVTVMSNMWLEGGWHRLQDMLRHTEKAGYVVALQEADDMSLMPYDAIGIMRACAAMMALDAGVEWCLMVDTDALLEKDTLIRLLTWDRPIVVPYLVDMENRYPGAPLSSPVMKPNAGLQPVVWAAMSVMLFNVKVFNCLDAYAWHGHDYHFAQQLGHFGHRIYMDTNTTVNLSRGPARNLGKTWDEVWAAMRATFERSRNQDRDRRPPPGFDPVFGEGTVTKDGVYFAVDPVKNKRMNSLETEAGKEIESNAVHQD